jgi:hypothetical protein
MTQVHVEPGLVALKILPAEFGRDPARIET